MRGVPPLDLGARGAYHQKPTSLPPPPTSPRDYCMASLLILIAETASPTMDVNYWITIASRVLHILSAAILIGGLCYLRLVVAPSMATSDDSAQAFFSGRRAAWARWVMIATAFLVLSGLYNLLFATIFPHEKLPPKYHMLFGIKFLLSLYIFFVAAALAGTTSLAERMRGSARGWLNSALVAAIVLLTLAAVLRSYEKVPRAIESEASPPSPLTSHLDG